MNRFIYINKLGLGFSYLRERKTEMKKKRRQQKLFFIIFALCFLYFFFPSFSLLPVSEKELEKTDSISNHSSEIDS